MSKPQMDVIEFGKQLVLTGDIDPVYIMLHDVKLPYNKLYRWLLAYWCFYHCGTASWMVDQVQFWPAMNKAARSSQWPRSSERRHFRGTFAIKAVLKLREICAHLQFQYHKRNGSALGDVEALFDTLCCKPHPVPLATMMLRAKCMYGFGDWIGFKVADMLERLGLCPVEFSEADTFLFDSPREGAELVKANYSASELTGPDLPAPEFAMGYLERHLGELPAPPRYERTLNGQEYETILCKWKSHLSGHYHVGKDITEIKHGLMKFCTTPTAQLLLKGLPECLQTT